MNDDFDIDMIDRTLETPGQHFRLPVNFVTAGEIHYDDLKIYIKQDIYKRIERYSSSDVSKELGSVLFGEYLEKQEKFCVVISDYVEAKFTDSSASTLTFTHKTWDYIHDYHSRQCTDLKIIGWQHTHPNYGIFLSGYDMFIQENFFNLPFQVAYVVDPIQKERGFFQWKNGSVEKLEGFYVYDEIGKNIQIESSPKESTDVQMQSSSKMALNLLTFLFFSLTIGLIVFFQLHNAKIIDELSQVILKQQLEIDAQKELTDKQNATSASTDNSQNTSIVKFKKYTVQPGDSLYSICERHGIDFSQNLEIIQAVNGIADLSTIQVGQSLLLPMLSEE